jgi:hypothetical protein
MAGSGVYARPPAFKRRYSAELQELCAITMERGGSDDALED